jgi:hypothetical protein
MSRTYSQELGTTSQTVVRLRCDRCSKEEPQDWKSIYANGWTTLHALSTGPVRTYHLCPDCRQGFDDWIRQR